MLHDNTLHTPDVDSNACLCCRFISAAAKLEQHPLLQGRVHDRDGKGTLAALSHALQQHPALAGDWGALFARAHVLPDDRDKLRQFLLMVIPCRMHCGLPSVPVKHQLCCM